MKKFVFVLTFMFSIVGCSYVNQKKSDEINDRVMMLEVGMSKSEVMGSLGKPLKREVYGNQEYLIYETDHLANTEREKFTPLAFINGKLVGWGQNYYDDSVKHDIKADIKIIN